MNRYVVGVGDSPRRIAEHLTGNSGRYLELLAANPHKTIAVQNGQRTFASLGVGECLCLPRQWRPDTDRGLRSLDFGLATVYGDALASVNLHPDNPDNMRAELQKFLTNPAAYKQGQKYWKGPKDAYVWHDNKGTIELQWPFHWGKWMQNAPTNEAQVRAVFEIPAGTSTEDGLRAAYGLGPNGPFPTGKPWKLLAPNWEGFSVGKVLKDIAHPFESAYNAAVPALAKAAKALAGAAPFLSAIPLVGPALTGVALSLAAAGPALEKLREKKGVNPSEIAGVAQAALAAAPGGAGASVQQLVTQAPQFTDTANALKQLANAAKPTVAEIQQGQALLSQATQTTPHLQSVAQAYAPHVLGDVTQTTVPAAQATQTIPELPPAPAYGPYPQTAGTTAGVGDLGRGGGWHGGGGRGGGHAAGARHHAWAGDRRRGRGGRWWATGAWWPYVVGGDGACARWGAPINFSPELLPGLRATLAGAGNMPVAVQGADGNLYRLSFEPTTGVTVRPCVVDDLYAIGTGNGHLPCPADEPPPAGYAIWKGRVSPDLSHWATDLRDHEILSVPYGHVWTREGDDGSVTAAARKDHHTWTYIRKPDGTTELRTGICIPGITLYRPTAPAAGVSSADNDVLRVMALDLLADLRRRGSPPQFAFRSAMSFQRAWNEASADTPITADGKYVGETQAALDAALRALAPGSGPAPQAIL